MQPRDAAKSRTEVIRTNVHTDGQTDMLLKNWLLFLITVKIKAKEKELELRLAIHDAKTYSSFVMVPYIDKDMMNGNVIYNCEEKIRSEEDEWNEIIADLRSRFENCDKSSSEKLKPDIRQSIELERKNESDQQEDFIYDFHEVQ